MSDDRKPAQTSIDTTRAEPSSHTWTGTGLCPEAQGDGVPCHGTEGECEVCGRALPPASTPEAAGTTDQAGD